MMLNLDAELGITVPQRILVDPVPLEVHSAFTKETAGCVTPFPEQSRVVNVSVL